MADAIARTAIEEVTVPRVDRDEGREVAPCKAGISCNAGVDDRIVAVALTVEIVLRIACRIIVHVDDPRLPASGLGGEDQNFLAMLNPMMRGSSVKTLVVRPLSSLFRNASVIGVELKTFFT